jgi:hypothetical protein
MVAATISWPSSQRVTSISWTTESVESIALVNESGTLALRCTQWTWMAGPISPSW